MDDIREEANDLQETLEMGDYLKGPFGKESLALHHSQVSLDPYNFFVVKRSLVGGKNNEVIAIINPVLLEVDKNSRTTSREGCISFPFRNDKKVLRYGRIKVKYQVPDSEGKELITREEWTTGIMANIFQHEIDHANAENIYQNQR